MKRAGLLAAALGLTIAVLCAAAPTQAQTAPAGSDDGQAPPAGVVSGELDTFAVRVEYDIPLPAGPGTIPHAVGEIRRSVAGENAKGLSAAPSHFDAVVGGTYADPSKDQKGDERRPPGVECFYPGDLVNSRFVFPTDTQAETASVPPTSYATAQCGAGPSAVLRAAVGSVELPGVSIGGGGMANGATQPNSGRVESGAASSASGIVIAEGAVTVDSVDVSGESSVDGTPDGAQTIARVTVKDIVAAGTRFSIANDRLIVAGQDLPIDGAAAHALLEGVNGLLQPSGCRLDITTEPATFPQGFLLSRKPPAIGIADDGSRAASMRAGLMVLCDLPRPLTEPTGYSPQRVQVVLGFVYTSAAAEPESAAGGFSLGSLASFDTAPAVDAAPLTPESPTALPGTGAPPIEPALLPSVPVDERPPPPPLVIPPRQAVQPVSFEMDPQARVALGFAALLVWVLLTHLALTRLRGVTQDA